MTEKILEILSKEFHKFDILKIKSGASQKKFYRINHNKNSFIIIDYILDKKEYDNHLKIYNLLKSVDISIPKIIERNDNKLILITEDFGDLRFDKILTKYPIKNLLYYAIDSLIVLKNQVSFEERLNLDEYNYDIFKNEILELPMYYFSHINLDSKPLTQEFLFIWSEAYKNINFKNFNFIHKDFNLNNLILIPSKKKHLKCGVIDFQSAFWGEDCWDLFSLLEDSRIFFTDEFNDHFINYFYSLSEQNISLNDFKIKFNFLNSARQTRLLGRWVKLSKELNQNFYLDFIPVTKKRLKKSINLINNKKLIAFYDKYIFN